MSSFGLPSPDEKSKLQQTFSPSEPSNDVLDAYLHDLTSSPQDAALGFLDFQLNEISGMPTSFASISETMALAPSPSTFSQEGLSDTAASLLHSNVSTVSSVSTPLSSSSYGIPGSAQSSSSVLFSPSNNQQFQQQQQSYQSHQSHQTTLLSPPGISSPSTYTSPSYFPQNDFLFPPSVESPLQDNDNATLNEQFLIPGKIGHYRSNSSYSETSSAAHSPAFLASSPVLPFSANSPLLFDDNLVGSSIDDLEQLADGFTLGDPSGSGQLSLEIPQLHDLNNSSIQSYNNHSPSFTENNSHHITSPSPTPEITIDIVDPPVGLSPYNSSPGFYTNSPSPVSPTCSDSEPFPPLDGSNGLLPPSINRPRSQSDSDLDGGATPQGNSFYSVNNSSNVSISSVSSEANSYLSPNTATKISERGAHSKHIRNRSSSASQIRERSRSRSQSASREYILELASMSPGQKKVQRHPSAFACDMCDKRFTRAYNLRSHKRTHTNERPYVCSVCSKAFARQHDRKRHEALHSGEKKYECKGVLADGVTQWGCGHKFARADALGRHFRTEAGKECIRSLVEESEREKSLSSSGYNVDSQGVPIYDGSDGAPALTLSPPATEMSHSILDAGLTHYFPAALLEQFPALSNFGSPGDFKS